MRVPAKSERSDCELSAERSSVLQEVSRHVLALAQHHDEFVDLMVHPLRITKSHVPLILLLAEEVEVPCQNEIARHLDVDKGTVSRNAARLIELGYVEQHPSPVDARASHLRLTERGHQLVEPLRHIETTWVTGLGMGIDGAEKVRLMRCLALMTDRAEQLVSDVRTGNLRMEQPRRVMSQSMPPD